MSKYCKRYGDCEEHPELCCMDCEKYETCSTSCKGVPNISEECMGMVDKEEDQSALPLRL